MAKLSKLFITKCCALLLVFPVLLVDFSVRVYGSPIAAAQSSLAEQGGQPGQPGQVEGDFATALKDYKAGLYKKAIEKLTALLEIDLEKKPAVKAKVYLLLGACYEKLGQKEKARDAFSQLKAALDKGIIDRAPAVPGIDPGIFPAYREVFEKSPFFDYKEPVPAAEMIKKKVVHAPRKSMEQKEKEKKKKKFPWLIAIGAVVILGVTAVLLLYKKSEKKTEFTEVQWVHIPAGEFLMGDNFNEGDPDEQPVHEVYLDEYYISKYEISVGQFNYFKWDTAPPNAYTELVYGRSADFPIRVSYHEAAAFCQWLSRRNGANIRLPTEAQWEKAARGTQQYRYPWGDSEPDCASVMYADCSDSPTWETVYETPIHGGMVRVYYLEPGKSPYGAYNMAGNIWEWCRDWYDPGYYSVSPRGNPQGPAAGSYRVIRGGCHMSDAHGLRSANREYNDPGSNQFGIGLDAPGIGFRVVKEAPASRK